METINLESDLWEAADQLRANSKLTAAEYSLPVLGLIFLRHAYNRFLAVKSQIEPGLPMRGGVRAPLQPAHFQGQAAIFLHPKAQYNYLVDLPEDQDIGAALVEAMKLIEAQTPMLAGALPKEYTRFEPKLLRDLLRIFNREALKNANGDVFGRIYEYFLNKFAMSGAQEGGEFFTPPSLVRLIVNVIEPDHGIIFDPACGSGGMFVWTGHYLHAQGIQPAQAVTYHGQEKAETNTRLSRMNLAVHGLEGQIREGNTFYDRRDELVGACDYVMANPPFNVDGVDPARLKNDLRLPFGLPGLVQKSGAISNANYLWIQYFYSYLNERGRAGFVMASSATDAGHAEKAVRQKLLQTGHVDAIIAIGTNFFYTLTLPCTLWFFDKRKPAGRMNRVLMLDARSIYRVVTRKIRDFSDEQLANLTAIIWLYRGETGRYGALVGSYLARAVEHTTQLRGVKGLNVPAKRTLCVLNEFTQALHPANGLTAQDIETLQELGRQAEAGRQAWEDAFNRLCPELDAHLPVIEAGGWDDNDCQLGACRELSALGLGLKEVQRGMGEALKPAQRALDLAEKTAGARRSQTGRTLRAEIERWEQQVQQWNEHFQGAFYFLHQVSWLQNRFPEAAYEDVPGLCKAVTLEEIAQKDWSLTPGRYVGVTAEAEDQDEFEARITEIHAEIASLTEEAQELSRTILKNFESLEL